MPRAYCQYGISFGLNSQPLNVRHFIVPIASTRSYFVMSSGLRKRSDKLRVVGDSDVSSEGKGDSNHIKCICLRLISRGCKCLRQYSVERKARNNVPSEFPVVAVTPSW